MHLLCFAKKKQLFNILTSKIHGKRRNSKIGLLIYLIKFLKQFCTKWAQQLKLLD